ncbi:MAG TPA: alpha/beta fold hydrolase, partial [Rectinemataceae bacterium]|nr:alpha/beta fold hydrolase [Rectinemataceae bacterium]
MKREEGSVFVGPDGEEAIKREYRRVLSAWPLPWEGLEFDTAIGRTFGLACGDREARPLVLLHGTLSNSSIWYADIAALAAGRRVYALDLPGEPGFSHPYRASWEDGSYAAWLAESLDRLGLERSDIAGISLGAWVALSLAAREPRRAGRLALLCPAGLAPPRASLIPRAILASLGGRRGLEALTRALYGAMPAPEGAVRVGAMLSRHARPRYSSP